MLKKCERSISRSTISPLPPFFPKSEICTSSVAAFRYIKFCGKFNLFGNDMMKMGTKVEKTNMKTFWESCPTAFCFVLLFCFVLFLFVCLFVFWGGKARIHLVFITSYWFKMKCSYMERHSWSMINNSSGLIYALMKIPHTLCTLFRTLIRSPIPRVFCWMSIQMVMIPDTLFSISRRLIVLSLIKTLGSGTMGRTGTGNTK